MMFLRAIFGSSLAAWGCAFGTSQNEVDTILSAAAIAICMMLLIFFGGRE